MRQQGVLGGQKTVGDCVSECKICSFPQTVQSSRLGESYQHQLRVEMGLGKGCSPCPAEISLGNKTPRESSSCLFFWAVFLILSRSKIRIHPPLKSVLKLATPALCLFQSLEKFQHNQLGYSIQGNSCPPYPLHCPWSHPELCCTWV